MQAPSVRERTFLRLTQTTLVVVVLNIVSGGAVRLTDSGLGCPDWPNCSRRSLTPALSFHPAVEFGNRMVVVVLTVLVAVTLVAALLRRPRRRDLAWLSAALVGGVLGEAVIGAVVVYSKLNPYAVMVHFLVGMALLTASVVLVLRAGRAPGAGLPRTSPATRGLAWAQLGVLALAVAAGTATTGAGPHAGGRDAVRLPVPLTDMARTHSGIVLVLGALTLVELALLFRQGAAGAVQERGRLLLAAMVAQGLVGYTQYFSHLPPLLVGVHVLGVTVVWSAALWFVDGLADHVPERAVPDPVLLDPGAAATGGTLAEAATR